MAEKNWIRQLCNFSSYLRARGWNLPVWRPRPGESPVVSVLNNVTTDMYIILPDLIIFPDLIILPDLVILCICMLGAKAPAKIQEVTLMRPIHGNL